MCGLGDRIENTQLPVTCAGHNSVTKRFKFCEGYLRLQVCLFGFVLFFPFEQHAMFIVSAILVHVRVTTDMERSDNKDKRWTKLFIQM